jgi:hypothetical protein
MAGRLHGVAEAPVLLEAARGVLGHPLLGVPRRRRLPSADGVASLPDEGAAATAKKQLAKEGDSAKRPITLGWSAHFYVVTDIPRLKLLTQGGAPRVADQHEIVHLFLERAEKAYDDFDRWFGGGVSLGRPMAIYLPERTATKERWQASYFGNPKTDMIYGGGGSDKIAGGFCGNGFCVSNDEAGSDHDLHGNVRHMIGHILFSSWHGGDPWQKKCPKWAFAGAADWLCKLEPRFRDWTTFCQDEGPVANGSGKDWDKRAAVIAAGRRDPIEKLFTIPSLSGMSYQDLVRSWSYMDVMLREDRERWLAALRLIREGREPAAAFQEGLDVPGRVRQALGRPASSASARPWRTCRRTPASRSGTAPTRASSDA